MRNFLLKRNIRQLRAGGRVKELKSFGQVCRIAMLFDAADYVQAMAFKEELEAMGKKLRVWTYAEVESPEWEYAPEKRFITRKHLDFLYRPKKLIVDDYQGFPADMLMNLSHEDNPILDYLASLSPATFRVSFKASLAKDYDFVLAFPEDSTDFKGNAESLLFYLKNLRLGNV